MDLINLKYSDLQRLAKSHGIKANQKGEKLIEALKSVVCDEDISKRQTNKLNESGSEETLRQATPDVINGSFHNQIKFDNDVVEKKSDLSMKIQHSASPVEDENEIINQSFEDRITPKRLFVTGKNSAQAENACPSDYVQDSLKEKTPNRSSKRVKSLVGISIEKCQEKINRKRLHEDSGLEEQMEPMRKKLRSSLETNKSGIQKVTSPGIQQSNILQYSKLLKVHGKTAEYWSKVHQKMHEKMESIDEYQKKKNDRAALLLSGSKGKGDIKGLRRSPRLVAVVKPTDNNTFVPSIFTADKMDLNFGKKESNNTSSKEMSPKLKTPKNQSLIGKNVGSNKNHIIFSSRTLNTSALSSSKKTFDLAASLERPLTWVPYKGRVKPLSEESSQFRVNIKEIMPKTKAERVAETKLGWKSKRASQLMKKRNIK